MKEIIKPISILELGSTHICLSIFDSTNLNNNLFYEEKIDYTREKNFLDEENIIKPIIDAEKDLGKHLNEIILLIDSSTIHSLDFSIQKNFDNKIISKKDINYLINECEKIIKINNQSKEILHTIKSSILLDNKIIKDVEKISSEESKTGKITIELKFILIESKLSNVLKNLFIKKHISLKYLYCTSFIKSLGLINKIGISGFNAFIDIGHKKSSLTIFQADKLIYLNNIHLGGDHITKDSSKILKINYRMAESKKMRFSKKSQTNNELEEDELLRKIINSRLEEIVELLFLSCPLIKRELFISDLKIYFIGRGSKVLNENLLSFGNEFNFIKDMSIIDENLKDCLMSAYSFASSFDKTHPQKLNLNLENKGFFEKLFEYFIKK